MKQQFESLPIKSIRNEADYEVALNAIDQLFDAQPDTPEEARLEILITLVEAYEDEHYPIEMPDPIVMIEHVLDSQGLTRKDLEEYIGPRQRVWEIMEKRRQLTLAMIRRLEAGLNIPAVVLIQPYELAKGLSRNNLVNFEQERSHVIIETKRWEIT